MNSSLKVIDGIRRKKVAIPIRLCYKLLYNVIYNIKFSKKFSDSPN